MATTSPILVRFWPNQDWHEAESLLVSNLLILHMYNSLFICTGDLFLPTKLSVELKQIGIQHCCHGDQMHSAVTEEFGRTEVWFLTKILAFFTPNNAERLSTCIKAMFLWKIQSSKGKVFLLKAFKVVNGRTLWCLPVCLVLFCDWLLSSAWILLRFFILTVCVGISIWKVQEFGQTILNFLVFSTKYTENICKSVGYKYERLSGFRTHWWLPHSWVLPLSVHSLSWPTTVTFSIEHSWRKHS
jgi:hypothetical protein